MTSEELQEQHDKGIDRLQKIIEEMLAEVHRLQAAGKLAEASERIQKAALLNEIVKRKISGEQL
jgi:hypothetical protein